jgi:SAM-dependent methyltransferase
MMQIEGLIASLEQAVSREIAPKDEMYHYPRANLPSDEAARIYYFETGRELAVHLIEHLAERGLDPRKLDLLDYAAGYGRVTRWLAPAFKSVTVTDLDPQMLEFQRRCHGVDGFVPSTDPAKLAAHTRTYDVVFVFSLFTHLPQTTWSKWLNAISRLVRPGGTLVFSVHSYEFFAQRNPERFGDRSTWNFTFWEGNETNGRLSEKQYGCSIVSDAYARAAIDGLPDFEFERLYKMGEFDRYHDMYVARRLGQ